MAGKMAIDDGVIRVNLLRDLEDFRVPGGRASTYYLRLDRAGGDANEAVTADGRARGDDQDPRRRLKSVLKQERERIERLDVAHSARQSLLDDWEQVRDLAMATVGDRYTQGLACFVASGSGYARALRLARPVRDRAFFEDRFVLWPLEQILDQSDRYAICLTDKDEARVFLYYLGRIEELKGVIDEVPGRIRFPDPYHELEYTRKIREHAHHHFDRVGEALLHLLRVEPFEHLIIGGLWERLPDFESRLHRYLRERVTARWDIDVHTPTDKVLGRAREEEDRHLEREAQETWKAIQDQLPDRGALGPRETFAALWQRRVQTLLEQPDVSLPGFRCSRCGRLNLTADPCVECGGPMAAVSDVYEEAVIDAIEQDAHVRYWSSASLEDVDSMAAYKRF